MAQSESVRRRLVEAWPERRFEIVTIDTRGDREIDRPLPQIGGKGLFTEALERALFSGEADVAVHSLKDLPTELGSGLTIGAIAGREDPRDVWVAREGGAEHPQEAPPGSRVGTSSERRRALILAIRDDVEVSSVRGNVDTRLRKLDDGEYDALVMAAAGLVRLGLGGRITSYLDPPYWLPAPGQGALAVERRSDDEETARLLERIESPNARAEIEAERALLAVLEGGCQVPVGALARAEAPELALQALVALPDGSRIVAAERRGAIEAPAELGRSVADELIARGADEILKQVRGAPGAKGGGEGGAT